MYAILIVKNSDRVFFLDDIQCLEPFASGGEMTPKLATFCSGIGEKCVLLASFYFELNVRPEYIRFRITQQIACTFRINFCSFSILCPRYFSMTTTTKLVTRTEKINKLLTKSLFLRYLFFHFVLGDM